MDDDETKVLRETEQWVTATRMRKIISTKGGLWAAPWKASLREFWEKEEIMKVSLHEGAARVQQGQAIVLIESRKARLELRVKQTTNAAQRICEGMKTQVNMRFLCERRNIETGTFS